MLFDFRTNDNEIMRRIKPEEGVARAGREVAARHIRGLRPR